MPTSERDLVPARVERLLVLKDGGYVVLGTDEKALLIVIGPAEAGALARARRGERQERPLTHELLVRMLGAFDVSVRRVVISALVNEVFCATLDLERAVEGETEREQVQLDARASDSLVLAARTGASLFVARRVLDGVEDYRPKLAELERVYGPLIQDLDEGELGLLPGASTEPPEGPEATAD